MVVLAEAAPLRPEHWARDGDMICVRTVEKP